MKNTEQKIPTLRFPEFSGEWEEKRLGEVCNSISSGKTKANGEGDYPVYGSMGIIGFSNVATHNGQYLLVARVGANAGSINLVSNQFSVTDNTLIIDMKAEISLEFTYQKLISSNLGKLTFGSGQPLITGSQLKSFRIPFPTLSEQQKIADFLSAVDKRLQLLKDKKTKLEEYKRGVMQRIFSQELRFTRLDGSAYPDWEYKPLGEILDYEQPTKYLVDSTEYDDKYDTPVLTAGKTFVLGYTNETYGIYEENLPVIIFDDFTTASKFVTFPFKAKSSAMKILKAREGVNIRFVYEAMQRIEYIVGVHGRHWISTFSNMEIPYPHLDEQRQIADFLSAIDDKISLLNQQIQSTEQYKKGLLQQMFV